MGNVFQKSNGAVVIYPIRFAKVDLLRNMNYSLWAYVFHLRRIHAYADDWEMVCSGCERRRYLERRIVNLEPVFAEVY